MLTPTERSEFHRLGFLRLRGAIPEGEVELVHARIWEDLKQRCGALRSDPATWPGMNPKGINKLPRSGTFGPTCSPAVGKGIDDLLGADSWEKPDPWGSVLISFPSKGLWSLPDKSWHLDLAGCAVRAEAGEIPGIQVFAILESLVPQGGATVALAGSHRLVRRLAQHPELIGEGRSGDIRKAVDKAVPSLRALWSRETNVDREERYLRKAVEFDGVSVKVAEFTGEAGDVILMHPWIFHAAAPNCGNVPRIVITQRITKTEAVADVS